MCYMRTLVPVSQITMGEVERIREQITRDIENRLLMGPKPAQPRVAPRQANKEELAWWERLGKLMTETPSTMAVYAMDGTLRGIDIDNDEIEWPESLSGIEDIDICVYVSEDD